MAPALGSAQNLPSGMTATLHEVLEDRVGSEAWLRFRFVAPEIAREGGSVSFAAAATDMQMLCDTIAFAYLSDTGREPDRIAISVADRPVDFGAPSPDATQFFEVFSVGPRGCIWEEF